MSTSITVTSKGQLKNCVHIAVLQKFAPDILSWINNTDSSFFIGVQKDRRRDSFSTGRTLEYDCLYETANGIYIIEWTNYPFDDCRGHYYVSCVTADQLFPNDSYKSLKPVYLLVLDASEKSDSFLVTGEWESELKDGRKYKKTVNLNY